MSYPKNPDTIVLKNKFYPSGLKEIDIWNHYQKFKESILKEVENRDVMMFISIDNKVLLKRKAKEEFVHLTKQNYDELITGRTISIHANMNKIEHFGIVDIDIIDESDFKLSKDATKDCYNILKKIPKLIRDANIRFSGKTSFHILVEFFKNMNIDSIRLILTEIFKNSPISDKYSISKMRTEERPNIDLFGNKYRGGFIVTNALSVLGLRCMKLKYNEIDGFRKEKAKIK